MFATFYAVVFWAVLTLVVASRSSAQEAWPTPALRPLSSVQVLVDDLKARLAIERSVSVSIVPHDTRVVSVAPPAADDLPFQMAIESSWLGVLEDDELSAVIAHELGHVWVFTHHPYLQTERLANEIAMRVVSRDSLERVYGKVWARQGRKGDLASFLGPRPADPVTSEIVALPQRPAPRGESRR